MKYRRKIYEVKIEQSSIRLIELDDRALLLFTKGQ